MWLALIFLVPFQSNPLCVTIFPVLLTILLFKFFPASRSFKTSGECFYVCSSYYYGTLYQKSIHFEGGSI